MQYIPMFGDTVKVLYNSKEVEGTITGMNSKGRYVTLFDNSSGSKISIVYLIESIQLVKQAVYNKPSKDKD